MQFKFYKPLWYTTTHYTKRFWKPIIIVLSKVINYHDTLLNNAKALLLKNNFFSFHDFLSVTSVTILCVNSYKRTKSTIEMGRILVQFNGFFYLPIWRKFVD